MLMPGKSEISLYFHVPFCTKKCDYCHFYVIPDKNPFKIQYMEGLELEWNKILPLLFGHKICSIYFGGGTPSLLGADYIEKILSWTRQIPWVSESIEITLEANPENISKESMAAFANVGINRVSIGIQSLDDGQLLTLSRQHDAKKAKEAVITVHEAGISNISIDLMYDLPSQMLEQWKATLIEAVKLPITHLSLYNLVFEPHTVYYKKRALLKSLLPSESESASMYKLAVEICRDAGLMQYEISAFQKNNHFSKHNTGYWQGRSFWGFGPSAFSYWEGKRFRNAANLNFYYKNLKNGLSPIDYEEELKGVDKLRELLAINLRLLEGVNLYEFQQWHGELDQETFSSLHLLERQGLVYSNQKHIHLTEQGILFYDSVATEII